jgi:hypothetical protein
MNKVLRLLPYLAHAPVVCCLVFSVQLRSLRVGWAAAVGVSQQALYAHQHCADVVAGRPLVLDGVHADVAITVDCSTAAAAVRQK